GGQRVAGLVVVDAGAEDHAESLALRGDQRAARVSVADVGAEDVRLAVVTAGRVNVGAADEELLLDARGRRGERPRLGETEHDRAIARSALALRPRQRVER